MPSRPLRFDESILGPLAATAAALGGLLLIVLGRVLRAGDDNLADFD
jgi:hypothetical protein